MKSILAVAIEKKQKEITKEHEEKFLEFINRNGMPYEKILLKNYYPRIKAILTGENPPPYEIEIQATSKCNANCTHCWAKDFEKLEDRLNTKESMDRIINQALNFEKNGFKIDTIKFCGSTGEPLVNPFAVYAINKIYGKRFLRFFTNGIKLAENKDNLSYLLILSKINRFNVSIDAGSTQTLHKIKKGSSHIRLEDILDACAKIKYLSENGTSVEASYVITNENYKEILEFVKKVKDFGAANLIRFRIDLTDRTVSQNHGKEILDLLKEAKPYENENFKVIPIHSEEEIKEKDYSYFTSKESGFKCFTSKIWACIGSNGNLYPCGHIVAGDTKNYGSVLEKDMDKVWESYARISIINKLPIGKCSICSPFSLRINRFLTEISKWSIEEIDALYKKHIKDD